MRVLVFLSIAALVACSAQPSSTTAPRPISGPTVPAAPMNPQTDPDLEPETGVRDLSKIRFVAIDEEGELAEKSLSWAEAQALPEAPLTDETGIWFESELALKRFQVQSENQSLVDACADAAPFGRSAEISRQREESCSGGSLVYQNWVAYRIARDEKGVSISLKVRLKNGGLAVLPDGAKEYQPASGERFAEMVKGTQACEALIERIWARYGLNLDLLVDGEGLETAGKVDHEVALVDDTGRSSTGQFFYQDGLPMKECEELFGSSCEEQRSAAYCGTLLHETGHFLGLSDEYEDSSCPGRATYPDEAPLASAMGYSFFSPKETELMPRHLREVLSPICK